MINHVVLLRLRAGVTADSPSAQAAHSAMLELPARIPVIRSWLCGFNMTPDALAWDYVLNAVFSNAEEMNAYFEHPAHLAVVALWEPIAELAFGDIGM